MRASFLWALMFYWSASSLRIVGSTLKYDFIKLFKNSALDMFYCGSFTGKEYTQIQKIGVFWKWQSLAILKPSTDFMAFKLAVREIQKTHFSCHRISKNKVDGFKTARLCHFQNTSIYWIWVNFLPTKNSYNGRIFEKLIKIVLYKPNYVPSQEISWFASNNSLKKTPFKKCVSLTR